MVFFNYSTMQMVIKVVYYGPGLCGKTTNLEFIYSKTSPTSRGEMVSLETETDRTLFFDLLPIDVGVIGGFKTRFQLYTVPGQVFYNSTRQLVLKGVDGIIFVADSQQPMLDANLESFQNMIDNLKELGLDYHTIPIVLQYNKRDLTNIVPVDVLNRELNKDGFPYVEAEAINGKGVFETLKLASKHTLLSVKKKMVEKTTASPAPPPAKEAKPQPPREKAATAPAPAEKAPEAAPAHAPNPSPAAPAQADSSPRSEGAAATAPMAATPLERTPEKTPIPTTAPTPAPAPEPEPPRHPDTPQLTLDDLDTSSKAPAEPSVGNKKKRKVVKSDLDVDELLNGLVPSKQTFIKKLQYQLNRQAFRRIASAHLTVAFRDADGNTVETREFDTRLTMKKGTRKVLLKLNIDLES